jgi:hypothetical protein
VFLFVEWAFVERLIMKYGEYFTVSQVFDELVSLLQIFAYDIEHMAVIGRIVRDERQF